MSGAFPVRVVNSQSTSSLFPLSSFNGEAFSCEHIVKYLGVQFSFNMTWWAGIESVFFGTAFELGRHE